MSTATHNHAFSQQSTPTKGKPPLIRIGSRPGSRKGRPIYPTDVDNSYYFLLTSIDHSKPRAKQQQHYSTSHYKAHQFQSGTSRT